MFNINPGHYHNQGRLNCGIGLASTIGEEIKKTRMRQGPNSNRRNTGQDRRAGSRLSVAQRGRNRIYGI